MTRSPFCPQRSATLSLDLAVTLLSAAVARKKIIIDTMATHNGYGNGMVDESVHGGHTGASPAATSASKSVGDEHSPQ